MKSCQGFVEDAKRGTETAKKGLQKYFYLNTTKIL